MVIKYPVRERAFQFRLAGMFFFATLVAIGLAAGREFGYAAVACFAVAPLPIIVYLRTVRFFMDYMDVSSHSRSVLTNLVLTLGLLIAILGTLMLIAAGGNSLRI
ncbi:MAG: hypothetical protein U0795_25440 [Pirellulales bacterium]